MSTLLMYQKNNRGFSTIVAILITAFLTILSAGILNLIVTERNTNAFLFDGISAYMRAEGSLEYALLKGLNHREGFQDSITADDDVEAGLLTNPSDPKKSHIRYDIHAFDTSYSGSIDPGAFEIIPLFYDEGKLIGNKVKNPNSNTTSLIRTKDFNVILKGPVSWNVIGNDGDGKTVGIAGTGGVSTPIRSDTSIGVWKGLDPTGNMTAGDRSIQDFFTAGYVNNYLILSNPSTVSIDYTITSSNGFSLPKRSIVASSRVGNSKQNIEFKEDRSRLFDMLKYSIFSNN